MESTEINRKIYLTFCSGVSTVTGANFLLEVGDKKLLIDCGLEQGSEIADSRNREDFEYDPATIDVLLVTHAHMDHIGRIPKLIKDGFKGVIYSTPATLDLSKVMLADALGLITDEAQKKGVLPMYEKKDVETTFTLWKTIPYYTHSTILEDISIYMKDSGHILGSVMYEISVKDPTSQSSTGHKKIVFTGDLGNSPSLFLRDTDTITDATYMIMESVCGARNHESKDDRKQKFKSMVLDTIKRNRTLIIPAFSLERTQDILFELNDLFEREGVPEIKVFVDSPLATRVTDIYKRYTKDFKDSAQKLMSTGDDLFDFPRIKFTTERSQSEAIEQSANPKIILAGSGMSNGGRILKHELRYLPDPNATILLVGYQSAGTLGRQILDGSKNLNIHGERIHVRAEVHSIMGYSSHKDSDNLIEFVEKTAPTLKKVFVAMGEPKSALFLVQRLRDYLNVNATFPKKGERVELL